MGKIIDHNNFWYIEKNPISKTGVFPYLGREIGFPGLEPNKIYYVLRSEQELMSPEAIKSFELLPITKGHRMLGPQEQGLTPAEKIPQQGVVGEKVFAEGDTLYANIKVTSEQAKNDINNGLKELSLGYFCRWVKETGEYKGRHYDFAQKNIRGNHLAIVPLGRMGHDVRVMDALPAGAGSYALDSLELSGPFVSALLPAGHIPLKLFNLPGQAQDEDKITWITVKGNHIPIKEGQSKEDALKAFFDKKESEGKDKKQEKTENQDIFTPSAELAERFKKEVQAVLADDKVSPRTELSLGEIPQIYVNLGLAKGELKTNKMTLLKALGKAGKHPHNVPINVLEELPALITDPQAVFKSLSTSSNPSGYISVLDAVDKEGKPIVAVISHNEKDENEISFIPSIYERNNFNNFVSNVIKENGILYVKERTVLPSLHNAVLQQNTVLTDKILTKEDFVKDLGVLKVEKLSDISITEMLENAEDGMNLFIEEADPRAQDEWDESKHKRDAEGKFTSGGGAKKTVEKYKTFSEVNKWRQRATAGEVIIERFTEGQKEQVKQKTIELLGTEKSQRLNELLKGSHPYNSKEGKEERILSQEKNKARIEAIFEIAKKSGYSSKDIEEELASALQKIKSKGEYIDLDGTKTNGTDGISAAPEDKENAKMDKRKVIEEIMAIAAKPADKFKDGKEEQIRTIAGLAEKLAYNKSERGANDEDAANDKDKAKDEDNPSKTDKDADKKAKKACDKADKAEDAMEARIAANFAKKAALYEKVSPFTGSFDHNPMTLSQMAKYACDKLGIKGVAEDGAQTALEGYLVGAQKQAVVRQAKGASMDAAPENDAAFENYLKEAE